MKDLYPEDIGFDRDLDEMDYDDLAEDDEDEDYNDYEDDTMMAFDSEYDPGEAEELIEELMDDVDDGGDELDERRRFKRYGKSRRKGIKTASVHSAYRRLPGSMKPVLHKDFKRVTQVQDRKIARNAKGIRTVNARLNGLRKRVAGVARVNSAQRRQISTLRKRMRTDGAIDIATSLDGNALDLGNLARAAAKMGVFDKGALSNPYIVAGAIFVLQNRELLFSMLGGAKGEAVNT